jgi:hypothetical protein
MVLFEMLNSPHLISYRQECPALDVLIQEVIDTYKAGDMSVNQYIDKMDQYMVSLLKLNIKGKVSDYAMSNYFLLYRYSI